MKAKVIQIGGTPFTLTPLDASVVMELHEEFKRTAPCPVKELLDTAALLPDDIKKEFIKEHLNEAYKKKTARNSLESPEFGSWVQSAGYKKMIHSMFKTHHGHLSPEQCFSLYVQAGSEGGEDVFAELFPSDVSSSKDKAGRREDVPSAEGLLAH